MTICINIYTKTIQSLTIIDFLLTLQQLFDQIHYETNTVLKQVSVSRYTSDLLQVPCSGY